MIACVYYLKCFNITANRNSVYDCIKVEAGQIFSIDVTCLQGIISLERVDFIIAYPESGCTDRSRCCPDMTKQGLCEQQMATKGAAWTKMTSSCNGRKSCKLDNSHKPGWPRDLTTSCNGTHRENGPVFKKVVLVTYQCLPLFNINSGGSMFPPK